MFLVWIVTAHTAKSSAIAPIATRTSSCLYARTSILAWLSSNLSNHHCAAPPSPEGRSVDRREGRHGPAATYRSNRWLLHLSTDLYAAPAGGVDAGGASSSSVGGSSGGSSGVGGGGGGGDLGFNAVFAAMSPRRPPKTIMVLRGRASIEARVSGQWRRQVVNGSRRRATYPDHCMPLSLFEGLRKTE